MSEIRNIILCGMGAIGAIYADKLQHADCDFRVLVDRERYIKYRKTPVKYNNKPLSVKYLLPDETNYKADLILIATKMSGLSQVLDEIKNFVSDNTVILSLINGVESEQIIAQRYGREKVLYAYFIGHSSVRTNNSITHDGVNTIVFGSDNKEDCHITETVKNFFDKTKINYTIPKDIKYSLWLKFMLNVCANPLTAMFRMTFGEFNANKSVIRLATNIMKEVQTIAKAEGINNTENMIDDTLQNIRSMSPEGKTSMLQDVEAGRTTEIDIFAGAVVKFGEKHNIPTPYCKFLKEAFDVIHEQQIA